MKSRPGVRRLRLPQHSSFYCTVHTLPHTSEYSAVQVHTCKGTMKPAWLSVEKLVVRKTWLINTVKRWTRFCALLLRGQELAQGPIVYTLYMPTLWVKEFAVQTWKRSFHQDLRIITSPHRWTVGTVRRLLPEFLVLQTIVREGTSSLQQWESHHTS